MRSTLQELTTVPGRAPLTLPRELWATLSPAQQGVYRRAESLLDMFSVSRRMPLSRVLSQGPHAEVLRALQVLGGMSLVEVEAGDEEPTVILRALPDEHVRITGLDGKPRWIFVARPLEPPLVDPQNLN